jgi:hypothetical protein
MSNTKALEQKGWTGICVDPFPRNMQGRTCQIFKEVVFSKAGERVKFWAADEWGGIIDDTFGFSKDKMQKYQAPTVELTTVTLADILECVFRTKSATHSDANRPLIPEETGHRSGAFRPPLAWGLSQSG